MRARARDTFTTVSTEGAILPPDLLARIAENDKDLDGLDPASYHLAGESLSEAISRSWNRLQGVWTAFQAHREVLSEKEPGMGITRERWLLPLFSELDYGRLLTARAAEIEDKSYPISHGWQNTPIHLVGVGTDLDKRTPGVAGAARMSPHSMVQELINRSEDILWAFLSNGLRLRILRDNVSLTRQAYVEFDLEAMMDGEVYPDFVLLWLLCHQSRVEAERPEECWLERWSRTAAEQGTRALEELRDGVERALRSLGSGFLTYRSNDTLREKLRSGELDRHDYYRQLLRFVYRMLFLFVAEDRRLLLNPKADPGAANRYVKYYSTQRLRRLAERRVGGRHSDLYQGLSLVMQKLSEEDGCPELALPALGGFLFDAAAVPDLAGCEISNRDLLEVVRALSFVEYGGVHRSVDYKNLGAEELGSVYESLLELHPELDSSSGAFALETARGHERKTTGSYYTPNRLVNSLLDTALDPVLEAAENKTDPEAAILDLKVCDPACGSGHFLIVAAHRIAKRLAAVRTGDEEPSPEPYRDALRDVIGRCLYGVDLNTMAAELCKVSLWMEALVPGRPLSFLDHHIMVGNSLLGATPELVSEGIPDAAFEPAEDDDRSVARAFGKRNREERKQWEAGQLSLSLQTLDGEQEALARAFAEVEDARDESIAELRVKAARYAALESSPELSHVRFVHDTWCAIFVWPKHKNGAEPITQELFADVRARSGVLPKERREEVSRLSDRYGFFHWHLSFPHVFEEKGGFDVILGNPPYGGLFSKRERELVGTIYPHAKSVSNLAADFLEACTRLVNPRGLIGLVVPKSFTYSYSWRLLRTFLYPHLITVVDVGKAWKDVLLEQVLVTYSRVPVHDGKPSALHLQRVDPDMTLRQSTVPVSIVERLGTVPTGLSESDIELLRQLMERAGGNLGEICTTKRGTGLQRFVDPEGTVGLIGGKDIVTFRYLEPNKFIDPSVIEKRLQMVSPPQAVFQNIVAHLTRPSDHIRLIGTVVHDKVACLDTVNLLELRDGSLSPWGVSALLMSNLINWFVYACIYNKAVRTMHFDNYFINKIPLPPELDGGGLHDIGLKLESEPQDAGAWMRLNELVYDMYEVAPQTRQQIDATHKPRWL